MKVLIFLAVVLPACLAMPFAKYTERIVGGYPAGVGQFPHQVSLQINGQHSCGGSIISANTVLTAAHCIYGVQGQMVVVAGIIDVLDPGVRVPVAQYVMHQNYNPNSMLDDVALLRTASPIPLGGNVQMVQLRGNAVNPGETLTLSGWGRTSYPGELPRFLQWTNLGAIDLNTCSEQLAGAQPISAGHVCTSSPPNQGACQGDSGGPLIDVQYGQVGVVSWGIPCAKGYPDVFTSVPYYLRWIVETPKVWETL